MSNAFKFAIKNIYVQNITVYVQNKMRYFSVVWILKWDKKKKIENQKKNKNCWLRKSVNINFLEFFLTFNAYKYNLSVVYFYDIYVLGVKHHIQHLNPIKILPGTDKNVLLNPNKSNFLKNLISINSSNVLKISQKNVWW